MNAVPRTLVNGVAISLGFVALLGLYLGAKGSLDRPISEDTGPVMASSGAAAAMRNAATDAKPLAEPVAPPESPPSGRAQDHRRSPGRRRVGRRA